MVGHLFLRDFRLHSRVAYACMGGAALAVGYCFTLLSGDRIVAPAVDARLVGAILPIFAGAIAGVLYCHLAGRDPAPGWRMSSQSAVPQTRPDAEPQTYDGPVQVRTSIAALMIAATIPAIFVATLAVPLGMLAFGDFFADEPPPGAARLQWHRLVLPGHAFISTLAATMVPSIVIISASHGMARSLMRTRRSDYAVIGTVVSCIAALLLALLVSPVFLFPAAAINGALMGAAYRLLAGVEPLSLPEPVLVDDPARLVGPDHPSRRQHAVIRDD